MLTKTNVTFTNYPQLHGHWYVFVLSDSPNWCCMRSSVTFSVSTLRQTATRTSQSWINAKLLTPGFCLGLYATKLLKIHCLNPFPEVKLVKCLKKYESSSLFCCPDKLQIWHHIIAGHCALRRSSIANYWSGKPIWPCIKPHVFPRSAVEFVHRWSYCFAW